MICYNKINQNILCSIFTGICMQNNQMPTISKLLNQIQNNYDRGISYMSQNGKWGPGQLIKNGENLTFCGTNPCLIALVL